MIDDKDTTKRRKRQARFDVRAIALQAAAIDLRLSLWTFDHIAVVLGVSEHEARRMVDHAAERLADIVSWIVDDPPAMEQLERAEEVNSERDNDGAADHEDTPESRIRRARAEARLEAMPVAALYLRVAGWTYRHIAVALGVSEIQAHRMVDQMKEQLFTFVRRNSPHWQLLERCTHTEVEGERDDVDDDRAAAFDDSSERRRH